MPLCLICRTSYDPFISFGRMPIANGFVSPDQFGDEYFFELKAGFCTHCKMVQLVEQPDRDRMFHQDYPFFSSTSTHMTRHFRDFAGMVTDGYLTGRNPLVVEIGSNDGIMLQNFARRGIRHVGIEPSSNVAQAAEQRGVLTISEFFDEELAGKIIREHGQADAVLAANVICHIPCLHSVAAGLKLLLKPEGVFIFEDPYLGDIIEKTSYDQIYDEHAFYFSATSVNDFFSRYDLEIINCLPQKVHGGSMRYVIAHKGWKEISPAVKEQLTREEKMGLHLPETFLKFGQRVEGSKKQLFDLLTDLKKEGKRVVGYAATSKSTTVSNYCGIGPGLIDFISDTTPIKQGKYNPGTHIPVRPYEEFSIDYPDYALLFGWNHADEIMEKEKAFEGAGGKWIVYVPQVRVIE